MGTDSPLFIVPLTEVLSLLSLPLELRRLLYGEALELQPGLQAPALLLALAAEPELQIEALPIFKKVNFVLTLRNQAVFLALPNKDLLSIRHLTILWEGLRSISLSGPNPLLVAVNMAAAQNSLETITLDMRQENPFTSFLRCQTWTEAVKSLILGAQGGIYKITAVFDLAELIVSDGYDETRVLQVFFVMLGVLARQREFKHLSNLRVWVWEGNGREILKEVMRFTDAMIPS
jgi:hypothetical protein